MRSRPALVGAALALAVGITVVLPGPVSAAPPRASQAKPGAESVPEGLAVAAGAGATIATGTDGGPLHFVGAAAGEEIPVESGSADPETVAGAFVAEFGEEFGEPSPERDLEPAGSAPMAAGGQSVAYQQVEGGVPILAAELRVQVDGDGAVRSAGGELSTGDPVDTSADVDPADAAAAAVEASSSAHDLDPAALDASDPELWVYDPELIGEPDGPRRLVWRVEVTPSDELLPVWDLVLVDAHDASVALRVDQVAHGLGRGVCDRANVPGSDWCAEPYTRAEGQAPTGIADVDSAYDLSGGTYGFFHDRFGRDSVDGNGLLLRSTVRYCEPGGPCPYANAYWNGFQMVYGDGFASADDVVAHELTHAVTQYTSGLLYLNESGAINESLSDVFGELFDLTNGTGNDGGPVRWDIGEDLAVGAARDMADPGRFGDPDRMGLPNYYHGDLDNGGVHTNSGVNNKAASFLVDGGSFNGYAFNGLGETKTARIYYEAETTLLAPGSDHADLGHFLVQACLNAVGVDGIVATDCNKVAAAVAATEMVPVPPNDAFAAAEVLAGASGQVSGSSVGATKEAGEPSHHPSNPGGRSVWYRWTAPATGTATVDTQGSGFDTVLAVYTGSAVDGLTGVAWNDDHGGLQSRVEFEAAAGITYQIAVDGFFGSGFAENGAVRLNWDLALPPGTLTVVEDAVPDSPQDFSFSTTGQGLSGFSLDDDSDGALPRSRDFELAPGQYTITQDAVADWPLTALTCDSGETADLGARRVTVTLESAEHVTCTFTNTRWNDAFAAAEHISGESGSAPGSNVGASKEPGEPAHGGNPGGRSVWYRWTAPADGTATFHTNGSSFDTLLGVYTGVAVDALTTIASDDDGGDLTRSLVEFGAQAGVTYLVAVDGYNGSNGSIVLSWALVGPEPERPTNDDFADAEEVSGLAGSVDGSNVDATKEAGEPNHAGYQGGHSVWYRWTPTASGTATIDTDGSGFDTVLGVYTGSDVDALTTIASDDDSGEGELSRVEFEAEAGVTHLIAVDGAEGFDAGPITLNWSLTEPDRPVNDDFGDAEEASGLSGSVAGSNVDATKEAGEPNHAGHPGGHSVWYRWTPTTSGTATIDTNGSGFDTVLGVYTGSAVDALTTIASDDDSGDGSRSLVEFEAEAGVTYRVAIDGFNNSSGPITLNWSVDEPEPPPTGVSGTVTEAASGQPVEGALVAVLRTHDFTIAGGAAADENGDYSTEVAAGDYYLYVIDPSGRRVAGFFGSPTTVGVTDGAMTDADPVLASGRGAIAGTVTDSASGQPVGGAWAVTLDAATGQPGPGAVAGADGRYEIADLSVGDRLVVFLDPAGAHRPEFHPGSPGPGGAAPVPVEAGATAVVDASLDPTAGESVGTVASGLAGTVTEDPTGDPVAGAWVVALRAADYGIAGTATAGPDGGYALDLAPGDYKVQFLDPAGDHAMEWHDDLPFSGITEADTVTVGQDATTTVDAALSQGAGAIAGTVTDQAGATPLEGAWVLAIGRGGIVGGSVTGSDGTYAIADLEPGDYRITFVDPVGGRPQEYWDGSADYEGATPIAVGAGATVTVDAALGGSP